jgi:hypothetical protein
VEPEVAIDAHGRVVVIRSHEGVVQAESGPSRHNRLSLPVNLSAARATAGSPQVAVDSRGDTVAVWKERNWPEGHEYKVEASSRSHVTRVWRRPVALATSGEFGGEEEGPQVAMNARGDAVVVWAGHTLGPETSPMLQTAFKPAGGTKWHAPVDVAPESQFGTSQPQVGIDARGDAVIAWEASDATGTQMEVASKPAASRRWRVPVDLGNASPDPSGLQLAISASGRAAVVWERRVAARLAVVAVLGSVSGGRWRKPIRLASWRQKLEPLEPIRCARPPKIACSKIVRRRLPPAAGPRIALDARGDAVAVWVRASDANHGSVIQAAINPAGSRRWREPATLSGTVASEPLVAFAGQGEAVVVWRRISDHYGAIVEADIFERGVRSPQSARRRSPPAPRRDSG